MEQDLSRIINQIKEATKKKNAPAEPGVKAYNWCTDPKNRCMSWTEEDIINKINQQFAPHRELVPIFNASAGKTSDHIFTW
jgi:hypothetical protein